MAIYFFIFFKQDFIMITNKVKEKFRKKETKQKTYKKRGLFMFFLLFLYICLARQLYLLS